MKLASSKSYIKSISSMRCLAAAAFAGMAVLPAVAADYYWNPSLYEGFLSDDWYDASSNPGKPGDGDCERVSNARITSAGEYVLKVPTGGVYYDAAGTEVGNLPAGTKITFDATGATWVKQKTAGTAWGGGRIFNVQMAHHLFAIDSLNVNAANDWFGFTFQDGKMSAEYMDSGATFKLLSGTFNNAFLTDLTTATPHSTSILYTTSPGANVEFAGGTSYLRYVNVIGQSAGGEFLVSGGDHHVYGGMRIKTGAYGNADGILHLTGGSFTVEDNSLWIGNNINGKGIIQVDGEATFIKRGGTTYMPDTDGATGVVHVAGHGTYVTTEPVCAAHKNNSVAEFDVRGNGRLLVTNTLNLAEGGTYSTASLALSENAYAYAQFLYGAGGEGRKASISISDDATLEHGTLSIGTHAMSEVFFGMTGGHLVPTANAVCNFGNNLGGKVVFNFSGGDVSDGAGGSAVATWIFGGGRDSTAEISGGDIKIASLAVEGRQKSDQDLLTDWTNIVRQTGGTVTVSGGSNTGFDIRGNKRNAMYLLEGGTLAVNSTYFRLGHGGANEGYHAVFRQTGGEFRLMNGNGINFCDAGGSDGEAEFLGGVSYVHNLRGWNGCDYRGGTGKARCYFNGGTIRPQRGDVNLIYTMSECALGPVGGIFDTYGLNVKIRAKFQNDGAGTETEVDGRFVKAGSGTLTMEMVETDGAARGDYAAGTSLNSYHTYTRVDGGTLLLAGAVDVAFGRNVTVKGGGTLSLEGTAETLTVDTLTLGDGHGFAVLKLDAGDTVVVEAANGIDANCGAIDVPWKSIEGTHAVFTCKQGVLPGELDKIAVYDGDATKDYAWTTEVDNDTGYTICSVIVAPKGTLTKTITYSSGAVTTNGTGKVSGIIAEETGTQSGELVLASTALVSVDAGATLTVNGPLVGTGAEFAKSGSGKLVVGGSNPDFYGSFASGGGTFKVQSNAGFGTNPVNFPLILGNGTFKYTGEAVTFNSALKFQGATAGKSVILENDGDMTFTDVQHVSGTFVKKGVGALTLDLPAGSFKLGNDAVDGNYGIQHGQVVFPESGDAPELKTGLCGVTIAEGALKIKGEGVDKTTVATENTALLGTGYAAKAAPVLEVEDARVNFGKGSCHSHFMAQYPEGAPVPEIRLKNAFLYANSGNIGNSSNATDTRGPIITMKDSVFWGDYNTYLGVAGKASPEIDADNSSFSTDGMYGITIAAAKLTADFYGTNAVFGSYSKIEAGANYGGRIASQNHVTGDVKIRDGARMKTTRGINFAFGSLSVVFDGGIFEIASHNVESQRACTSVWQKAGTAFTTQGKGLEILIAEGSTHDFNFPVVGDGKVVKTGGGAFKLVEARAEGEKLLQYTGGTVVSNGTFVVDGSLVADGAKSFEVAEGAILDLNGSTLDGATISGAGVVTNGTLSAATIAYDADAVTTFSDVAFDGTLFVDFDMTGYESIDKDVAREGIVFAHYTGDAPAITRVKAVNTGIARATANVSSMYGDIVVAVKQSGFEVRIR